MQCTSDSTLLAEPCNTPNIGWWHPHSCAYVWCMLLSYSLCHATLSTAYAIMWCPSVCPSIHLSRWCILSNKHLVECSVQVLALSWLNPTTWNSKYGNMIPHYLKIFSTLGSHTIPVGDSPNWGVECRWGRQRSSFLTNIWLWHRWLVTYHQQFRPWGKVYHSRRWRRSAIATHQWTVLMTTRHSPCRSKKTEQNLIVSTDKSKAEVTIIKDGTRGIVLLKWTTDRHVASHGLSVTAQLLVIVLWHCWLNANKCKWPAKRTQKIW